MKINMKKYIVYLDDGKDCYKIAVPALNEREAYKAVEGNGEVIAIKDITKDCYISASRVSEALEVTDFSDIEIDLILRTLQIVNICD